MASKIRISIEGDDLARAVIRGMNPAENPAFVRRSLVKGGLMIQRNAAKIQIKRGGKGPALANKLTSRTGTGRRSIRVDRGGLSRFFVEIGSDLKYMQLHESGGTVFRRSHFRRTPTGGTAFVSGHLATYPSRPFLAPAMKEVSRKLELVFAEDWEREINRP